MKMQEIQIAQAFSQAFSAKASHLLAAEMTKGCQAGIYSHPVAIEPPFQHLHSVRSVLENPTREEVLLETPLPFSEFSRFELWLPPRSRFDWIFSELFLKQISSARYRIVFEIAGNQKRVALTFLCHQSDERLLQSAVLSQFPDWAVASIPSHFFACFSEEWGNSYQFMDFFPLPPYYHLLTQPGELRVSPLEPLIQTLSLLPESTLGIYQVVFQPTDRRNNWNRNVQILLDLEYLLKLQGDALQPTRYGQQTPSGDLRNFSQDLNSKAHNDKPFFATAVRLLLLDRSPSRLISIDSLSGIMNLFFHGGQPLQVLNEKDYQAILGESSIRESIESGLTYRPGFLLNSWELTGLVHFPSISRSDPRVLALSWTEPIRPLRSDWDRGTRIGRCMVSGQECVIHIPPSIRSRHTHIIGRPNMGKSNTMENMIVADIDQNHGVAVIDPHGDLIEHILHHIPSGKIERVIYFDPGDPQWAVIWVVKKTGE